MDIKKRTLSSLRNIVIVLFAFAAMGIMATIALNTSFMSPVAQIMKDFSLTDVYYYVLQDYGRTDTSRVVTIVDMTDLHERAEIANVLEEIESMNPKVVGVDIVFEGLKPDTLADIRLTDMDAMYTNTVFSYRLKDFVSDSVGYGNEVHSFFTNFVKTNEGFTNYERALYGGIKRKAPLRCLCKNEERTSLVYEVAWQFSDGKLTPHKGDNVNVNFRPTKFRVVPSDSVSYYRDRIENQIVLFGATHELSDMHYTPLGEMAGVELLAYSIQTLLEQTEVRHLDGWMTAVLSFFLVLITFLGRKSYMKWAKSKSNEWVRFFLTTTFLVGMLLFLWTAFLVWCGFVLFVLTGISLNLSWTMAAIPFLGGADEFYGLTIRRYFGSFTLF